MKWAFALSCFVGIVIGVHGEGFFPDLDYSQMSEKELLRYKRYFVRQLKKVNMRLRVITETKEADDKAQEDEKVKARKFDNVNKQKEVIEGLPDCAKACVKKFMGCQSNYKLEHNDPDAVEAARCACFPKFYMFKCTKCNRKQQEEEVRPLCSTKLNCSDEQCAVTPGGYVYSDADIHALDVSKITGKEIKSVFTQRKIGCDGCTKKQDYKKALRKYKKALAKRDKKRKNKQQRQQQKQKKQKEQAQKFRDDIKKMKARKEAKAKAKRDAKKNAKRDAKKNPESDSQKEKKQQKEEKKKPKQKKNEKPKPKKTEKPKPKKTEKPKPKKRRRPEPAKKTRRGRPRRQVPEEEDVDEEIDLDAMDDDEEEADHSEL